MRTTRTWSKFPLVNRIYAAVFIKALGFLLLSFLAFVPSNRVFAHTPESPEVQALVGKGVEFLRAAVLRGVPAGGNYQAGGVSLGGDPHNDTWGAQMLAAMVCYKVSGLETDPVVEKALARTRQTIASGALSFGSDMAYETSIAIIFLAEFGEKYRDEITKVLTFLLSQQQDSGGWMYNAPGKAGAGDTSVTQYAILAMWSAQVLAKVEVPSGAIVKACTWLARTQHVSGQFSYLPAMPGPSGRAQNGTSFRSSMAIAGVGSFYVCADLLKMNLAKSKALEGEDGLPKAFRLVNPPSAAGAAFDDSLRSLQKEVELGIIDGERVIAAQFPFSDMQYLYYTYYSYERFQSLKYGATKRTEPKEPEWYNRFVQIARDTQNPDGSWLKNGGRVADTAFMCLTLLRSMKKVIAKGKDQDGSLVGGRGLPGDTSKVAVRRGRVIGEPVNSKEDIMKVLEGSDVAALDDLVDQTTGSLLAGSGENRASQLAQIRTTLIDGDFNARRKAIKVLATDDHLDNVPLLIFALSDPDMEVVRWAEAGLRRVSRRMSSVEIPENASEDERRKRIDTWKTWYRNLRPDAIFLK